MENSILFFLKASLIQTKFVELYAVYYYTKRTAKNCTVMKTKFVELSAVYYYKDHVTKRTKFEEWNGWFVLCTLPISNGVWIHKRLFLQSSAKFGLKLIS